MLTLIADDQWKQQLTEVKTIAEIRDSHGQFLGYFRPAPSLSEDDHFYAEAMAHFDPEEIARIKAADNGAPGKTAREIFERLQCEERAECVSP